MAESFSEATAEAVAVAQETPLYPEHEKLAAVSDESQAVGEFLNSCGFTLCEWREAGDNGEPRYRWKESLDRETAIRRTSEKPEPDYWDECNGDAELNPMREVWDEGFWPVRGGIEHILAAHFGIDLDAIEREKRAMLDSLRAASATTTAHTPSSPKPTVPGSRTGTKQP